MMEGHLGHIGCSCSYRVSMFMYIEGHLWHIGC